MTQKLLDDFIRDAAKLTWFFKEEDSSLRHLIGDLRERIRVNNSSQITFHEALLATKNQHDERLTKYHPLIRQLCINWGVPIVLPPRAVSRPQPRLVSDVVAVLSPVNLLKTKASALAALGKFAVGDALSFRCSNNVVLNREREMREDKSRSAIVTSADVAAAGQKKYRQTTLKTVHDLVIRAEAGICTTFALAAAYILTEGVRQQINVPRVEIVGCARGFGTHMYVIVGRTGPLAENTNWGEDCYVVDCWQAAMNDGGAHRFRPTRWKSDFWMLTKLSQFYDNAVADPMVEELAQQVDLESLSRNQLRRAEEQKARQETAENSSELAFKVCAGCGAKVASVLMASHQRNCPSKTL